jgi:hypothetical protein
MAFLFAIPVGGWWGGGEKRMQIRHRLVYNQQPNRWALPNSKTWT